MNLVCNQPLGVFDSGIGGLTVVREVARLLPHENIIYFGDTAHVPYGTKSKESVIRFSCQNADVLLRKGVKAIVVACNTATSWALPILRREYPIPIIGVIEPGVKRACLASDSKRIGIIATPSTIQSAQYQKGIQRSLKRVRIFTGACPLFVPLAEEGWQGHAVAQAIAKEYLAPFQKAKVDTLILGCTHYPILKDVIAGVMGKDVILVDSAVEVAYALKDLLISKGLETQNKKKGHQEFLVSDDPKHFQMAAKVFLGKQLKNIQRC